MALLVACCVVSGFDGPNTGYNSQAQLKDLTFWQDIFSSLSTHLMYTINGVIQSHAGLYNHMQSVMKSRENLIFNQSRFLYALASQEEPFVPDAFIQSVKIPHLSYQSLQSDPNV